MQRPSWIHKCKHWSIQRVILTPLDRAGCYVCHRALRTCSEIISEDWDAEIENYDQALREKLQKYPDSIEEVLNTWPSRAKLWEKWDRDRDWRELRCDTQRQSGLLAIDADSYSRASVSK
jgi:hypothetical protein